MFLPGSWSSVRKQQRPESWVQPQSEIKIAKNCCEMTLWRRFFVNVVSLKNNGIHKCPPPPPNRADDGKVYYPPPFTEYGSRKISATTPPPPPPPVCPPKWMWMLARTPMIPMNVPHWTTLEISAPRCALMCYPSSNITYCIACLLCIGVILLNKFNSIQYTVNCSMVFVSSDGNIFRL